MGRFAHSGKLGGITLPLEIFRDPRLNASDMQFLVALMEYRDEKTGKINPGGGSIEAISGLSQSSIKRVRRNLKKYGWIKYTSGDTSTTNDYTMTIPLEAEFKYRTRALRMENGEWKAEVRRREQDARAYSLKRIRAAQQFYCMRYEELLEEVEIEKKGGINYIPDDALEMYEILRDGDNSYEARLKRKEERDEAEAVKAAERRVSTPSGVKDQYAGEYELDDFRG